MRPESKGMWLGVLGVAIFSLTLPFTRMAVFELNPIFVALGRAVVAALCSAVLLWYWHAPRPAAGQWRPLLIVSAGVVVGFPVFATVAMVYVPASHGAIVLGILPLATALFGAVRCGERPSLGFWLAALAGSALVVLFALTDDSGLEQGFHWADLALLLAVLAAAIGYAEGARLSQTMGGQQVISWALIIALPLLLPITLWFGWRYGMTASPRAWFGFAYVSLFSMFIGFFFWYRGLALGGIARVAQTQLLQPFMTLIGAALLLAEPLQWRQIVFACAVIAVVDVGRRMPVRRSTALAAAHDTDAG